MSASDLCEQREHLTDILDIGTRVAEEHLNDAVSASKRLAAPEQEMDADGNPTVTECVDCDADLGERARLGRIRCIRCQEILERKRRGLFRVSQ